MTTTIGISDGMSREIEKEQANILADAMAEAKGR